jgi:hypothetical protein
MFLTGISTRTLSMLSKRLMGGSVSPTEVRDANQALMGAVEQWRNRDLSPERIQSMCVDGVNFDMRMGDTIEQVPVLVAMGKAKRVTVWSWVFRAAIKSRRRDALPSCMPHPKRNPASSLRPSKGKGRRFYHRQYDAWKMRSMPV